MLWLEMSRDPAHGGGNWEFGQSLWSPSHKKGNTGGTWTFWDTLLKVNDGDVVLHLRGKGPTAAFIGTSTADGDGFPTDERPPMPGQWAYARSFYRVRLTDFTPFLDSIPLQRVFAERSTELRSYFQGNSNRSSGAKRHLFYVVQADRLQCLNGAYLSEVDDELATIILGPDFAFDATVSRPSGLSIVTGEQIRQVAARVGQQSFSTAVKSNYDHCCCFPGCPVDDARFLVGAHIARWSDEPQMRGEISNGLCLCLVHDRAFELGLFTLTLAGLVFAPAAGANSHSWLNTPTTVVGHELRFPVGCVRPSEKAIRKHWERIGFQAI